MYWRVIFSTHFYHQLKQRIASHGGPTRDINGDKAVNALKILLYRVFKIGDTIRNIICGYVIHVNGKRL